MEMLLKGNYMTLNYLIIHNGFSGNWLDEETFFFWHSNSLCSILLKNKVKSITFIDKLRAGK